METTRRSGFVILLVFSALVQCQSQVLDCRGRSSVCVGPLSYKNCQDNGNGQFVTDDNPVQTCPPGTRCDNEGIDSCTPLKNPSAQTIEAPLSEETNTTTTSKKSVDAESVSEVEAQVEGQTTSNATTDIIIEQNTTTSPDEESELKNETINTEPQDKITPTESLNITETTVDDSITPNIDFDSIDVNNTAVEKNNVTNAFNVTEEQVHESDQSYVEKPSRTPENTTTSQQNLNGTTEETDNALLEPTIFEQNVTGNFDENAENVTVSLINDTISKSGQEEFNVNETEVHQAEISQPNRTEELSPETSPAESTPAPSTSQISSTESTSEAIPTELTPVTIPIESTLPESTPPQALETSSTEFTSEAIPTELIPVTIPVESTLPESTTPQSSETSSTESTSEAIPTESTSEAVPTELTPITIPVESTLPESTSPQASGNEENITKAEEPTILPSNETSQTAQLFPSKQVPELLEPESTPTNQTSQQVPVISQSNNLNETLEETTPLEATVETNKTTLNETEFPVAVTEQTIDSSTIVYQTAQNETVPSTIPVDQISQESPTSIDIEVSEPGENAQQAPKVPEIDIKGNGSTQTALPQSNVTEKSEKDEQTPKDDSKISETNEHPIKVNGTEILHQEGIFNPNEKTHLDSVSDTETGNRTESSVINLPKGQETTLVKATPEQTSQQSSKVSGTSGDEVKPNQNEHPSRNTTQEQSPDSVTLETLPVQPVPQETHVQTSGVVIPQSTGTEQTTIETTATIGGTDEIKPSDSGLLQSNIPQEQRPISTTYESDLQNTSESSALPEITVNEQKPESLPTAPAAQQSPAVIPSASQNQTPVAIPSETTTSGQTEEQNQGINGSAVHIPSGDGTQLNQTELPQEEHQHTLQGQNFAAGESKPSLQTPQQVSASADKGKPAVQSIPTAFSSTDTSTVPNSQPSVDSIRPESTSGVQLLHRDVKTSESEVNETTTIQTFTIPGNNGPLEQTVIQNPVQPPAISETGINEVKPSETEVNETTKIHSFTSPGNNGPLEQTLTQNPLQPEFGNDILSPIQKSRPTQSLPEASQQVTVSNVKTSSKPLNGSAQNAQVTPESHIFPNNVQPNQIGVPQEIPPPILPEQSISSGAPILPQQSSTGIKNGAFGAKPNQLESPQSSIPQMQGSQITQTETILGSQKPVVAAFGISSASSESSATSEEGLGGIGSNGVLGTKPNQLGSSHSSVPQVQIAQSPQIEKTTPLGSQKPVVGAFGISSASSESSATSVEGLGGIGSNGVLGTKPNQLGSSHSSVPQVQTAQSPQIEKTTPLGSQKPVVGAFGISSASSESGATSEEGLGGIGSNGVLGTKPNQLGSSYSSVPQVQRAQSPQIEKTTPLGSQKPVVGAFGIFSSSSESSATSEEGLGGIGSNGVLGTKPNQLGSSHLHVPQVHISGPQKPVLIASGIGIGKPITSFSSESSETSEEGLNDFELNRPLAIKQTQLESVQSSIPLVQVTQTPQTEENTSLNSQKAVVDASGIDTGKPLSSSSSESNETSEEGLDSVESIESLESDQSSLSISSNGSLSNNSKESKESSESSSSKSSKSSDKSSNSSSSSSEDDDDSKEDKEKKKFYCKNEGRFADPNNCKKYYICSSKGEDKLKKYHLKCDKHKGYDPDKNKCTKHFDKCD